MDINSLSTGIFNWSIKARCTHKGGLRPYVNESGPGLLTSFVLEDDSGPIRVTAFSDAAAPVDDAVRVGSTYVVDSSHAWIRRSNPDYNKISPIEININSAACILEVISPGTPSQIDDDDGPEWQIGSPTSTRLLSASASLSAPERSPSLYFGRSSGISEATMARPLGPSYISLSDVHNLTAGRCDVKGRVSAIQRLDISPLSVTRRIAITDPYGVSVNATIWGEQARSLLKESDVERLPDIELLGALVRRTARNVALRIDSLTDVKVKFSLAAASETRSASRSEDTQELENKFARLQTTNWPPPLSRFSYREHEPTRYTVFVSHAGPDKETVALPLYEKLSRQLIKCFVDREELRPGDEVSQTILNAMNKAMVGVFILSPEFVARKWPFRELRCFMDRRRDAIVKGRIPPRIIPVFHRWTVEQCKDPDFYKVDGTEIEHVFHKEGFFDPDRQREAPTETVGRYMKELANLTGIVEHGYGHLVDTIARAVIESLGTIANVSTDAIRPETLTER